jgi:predicted nuclease with TOPRIM domain
MRLMLYGESEDDGMFLGFPPPSRCQVFFDNVEQKPGFLLGATLYIEEIEAALAVVTKRVEDLRKKYEKLEIQFQRVDGHLRRFEKEANAVRRMRDLDTDDERDLNETYGESARQLLVVNRLRIRSRCNAIKQALNDAEYDQLYYQTRLQAWTG